MGSTNPSAVASASTSPWQASDQGYLVATGDPGLVPTSQLVVAGTLYLTKLRARTALSISTVHFGLSAAGAGASTGSFCGLYASTGTLLSGSADIGAALVAGAPDLAVALTTPNQPVAAGGFVWAAFLCNLATTQASLIRASGLPGNINVGLTAATYQSANNGTGLVALPASITPASNASGPVYWWAALS